MSPSVDESRPRLEDFQQFLTLLARAHLGPQLQSRVDVSDIVQQTLLEAHRKLDQFRGSTEAEMAAWLRKMLSFNVQDLLRAQGRQKRNVAREQSLDASLDETCSRLEAWIEAVQTSPSGRVSRDEQIVRLAWAMEQLPETQRMAVELHHLHGLSLAETAGQLDCTTPAIAGLLRRGLSRLRELLDEPESKVCS
ncbi:MAG: sigma-70 family RNA polymerase sigma factor [Planctomycetota bacterium]|nr:sigma-70 family RNA polymerase sigma factor [Planctomycetota bacterium]